MPFVTFEPQNKIQTNTAYPRLTLEYQERALINCFEPSPRLQYLHTLTAPELDQNGKIMKEVMTNQKGGEYEKVVTEFIGSHLCLGDFEVVSVKGTDPDNCPTCHAVVEEDGLKAPYPRYAMNVLRYATTPGGWTLRDPFSVTVEAWAFSQTRFNELVDLAADIDGGDLRLHDLRLGPCENKKFQKFAMNLVGTQKAAWAKDKERQVVAKETFEKNKCTDLDSVIGFKLDKSKMLEDVATTVEKINRAYGRGVVDSEPVQQFSVSTPSVDAAVENNERQGAEDEDSPSTPKKALSFDDIWSDLKS